MVKKTRISILITLELTMQLYMKFCRNPAAYSTVCGSRAKNNVEKTGKM
jgi:hypothetical protein